MRKMSPKKSFSGSEHELLKLITEKKSRDWFNLRIANFYSDLNIKEETKDISAQEILGKINEFLKESPNENQMNLFLLYLSKFPKSMCQRPISKALEFIIGFHYNLSREKDGEKQHEPLSMEELANIFRRSKASIHECVKNTENLWNDYQKELKMEEEQEILTIAKRELIEEAKEKLRQQDRPKIAYPLAIMEKIQT